MTRCGSARRRISIERTVNRGVRRLRVDPDHEERKPVDEVRPPLTVGARSPFGMHKNQLRIIGDLLAPIDVA